MDVVAGADAGDLGGCLEQGVGHLTGQHVDLVGAGHRHQHVGILHAGADEYVRVATHAPHGADVQAVLEVRQAVDVDVDDGDIVGLAGQVLGQGAAHLAGADNDNLHGCASFTVAVRGYPSADFSSSA